MIAVGNASPQNEESHDVPMLRQAATVWLLSLVVLGCVVVGYTDNKGQASTLVFNALLPVFGTWAGALLAFYFSKESLDSATKNVNELTRVVTGLDRLKSVPELDKAIPFSAIYIPRDPRSQQPLHERHRKLH